MAGADVRGRSLAIALLGGPLAWTMHLFAVYLVLALWCSTGWSGRIIAVIVTTILALLVALWSGVVARGLWRQGKEEALRDAEPGTHETWDARLGERGARGLFIAVLAMFMAALFAFLILVQGVSPILSPECQAGVSR